MKALLPFDPTRLPEGIVLLRGLVYFKRTSLKTIDEREARQIVEALIGSS